MAKLSNHAQLTKIISNIASEDKPGDSVPDATPEEMKIFGKAGKHLSKVVFGEVRRSKTGVVSVAWSYGHWAYGSNDITLDGKYIRGDSGHRRGLCPNSAMVTDPVLRNVTLEDLIGGSASYYDSKVNLIKLQ